MAVRLSILTSNSPSRDRQRQPRRSGCILAGWRAEGRPASHTWRSRATIRKKLKGKPMPRRTARANTRKSAVREAVEHVFARQKGPMALFIRTIGLARARTKIGLANLTYNMQRLTWLWAQELSI